MIYTLKKKWFFLKFEICNIVDITLNPLKSIKAFIFLPLSKFSLEISTSVTRPFRSSREQETILRQDLHLSSTGVLTNKIIFKRITLRLMRSLCRNMWFYWQFNLTMNRWRLTCILVLIVYFNKICLVCLLPLS